MKEEEKNLLKIAQKRYKEIMAKEQNLLECQKELLELLENPTVKRYAILSQVVDIDYKGLSNAEIVNAVYPKKFYTENECEIFIYQGTYISEDYFNNDKITYDFDKNASYKLYKDLKTGKIKTVRIDESNDFENNNKVIFIPVDDYSTSAYYEKFSELREWYLIQLLIRPEKEVVNELLDKYPNKHERPCELDSQINIGRNIYEKIDNGLLDLKKLTKIVEGDNALSKSLSNEDKKILRLYQRRLQ